jgi:hypothetical protein
MRWAATALSLFADRPERSVGSISSASHGRHPVSPTVSPSVTQWGEGAEYSFAEDAASPRMQLRRGCSQRGALVPGDRGQDTRGGRGCPAQSTIGRRPAQLFNRRAGGHTPGYRRAVCPVYRSDRPTALASVGGGSASPRPASGSPAGPPQRTFTGRRLSAAVVPVSTRRRRRVLPNGHAHSPRPRRRSRHARGALHRLVDQRVLGEPSGDPGGCRGSTASRGTCRHAGRTGSTLACALGPRQRRLQQAGIFPRGVGDTQPDGGSRCHLPGDRPAARWDPRADNQPCLAGVSAVRWFVSLPAAPWMARAMVAGNVLIILIISGLVAHAE